MAYQLFQLPKAVPVASGIIVPGAKLSFFLTTTTTPTPVYTTSALNVAITQPVVADAAGIFQAIYLDPAITYKATLTDAAGSLLYTIDPVNDSLLSASIIGTLLYPRTAAEIAAGVTPVNYAIPSHEAVSVVIPERYSSNNDTALTSAFSVVTQLGGATVELRSSSYTVTSKKSLPNGLVLRGASPTGTTVNINGAIIGFSQEIAVHVNGNGKIIIENIKFVGDSTALGALLFDRTNYITVRKCQFNTFTAVGAYGIKLIEVYFHWISDCVFENIKTYGIRGILGSAAGPNAGTIGPRNDFIGNNQAAFVGVSFDTVQNLHIFDNDFEGSANGLNAIEIIGGEGIHINDNYIELWLGPAIKINSGVATKRVLIEQNVLNGVGPVVDLANAAVNDNIIVRQNRFSDITAGVTCINVGTTTNFVEYANDPNLGNITATYTNSNADTTRLVRTDTGTLTGCTTAPTATLRSERVGNTVTIQIPSLQATSNTTACTMTGAVTSILRPARTQVCITRYVNNGVQATGLVVIDTGGTLQLTDFAGNAAFFTAAGTKGFDICTVTYSLN